MRACGPFLLRKSDIIAAAQASIHAEVFVFEEQLIEVQREANIAPLAPLLWVSVLQKIPPLSVRNSIKPRRLKNSLKSNS